MAIDDDVLSRDEYKCSFCGDINNLEIHHISYRSHHGKNSKEYLESLANKITVCQLHHIAIHHHDLRVIYSVLEPDRPLVVTKEVWEKLDKNQYSGVN